MTEPGAVSHKSSPWRAIMIAMMLAFLGGLAVMGWALTHWAFVQRQLVATPAVSAAGGPVVAATPALPPPGGLPPAPDAAPVAPPAAAAIDESRVAALEARLADIDRHAAAASDQAARAEGMLIAAAARRAVDRGVALGYLEEQLTAHYGTTQPRMVANIIAASHAPVTLDSLRAGLDSVMTETTPTAVKGDWWGRMRASLSGLITVRKAGEVSVVPDERLARARLALSTGAVDNALAEVARLPGGASTSVWMANARRYLEAHSALDVLEAAALMRPAVAKSAAAPQPAPATPAPVSAGGSI
jgi:hypothetical protein